MDPIRPKFTPPSAPLQGPKPPETTPAASQAQQAAFEPAATAGPTEPTLARPTYQRLSARIQEAAGRGLGREQALGEVVADQARQLLGTSASPQMTQAITQAFQNDPHLSQIFNQLYNQATKRQ